jgi:uncharacterized protein (TIGR02996 family)
MREAELLAAMRAAPGDEGPIHVYADWLLSRGDPRGELIMLDQRERAGSTMTLAELDRLLELASEHGFPWLPDDPCAGIFRFDGGGAFPTQYFLEHGGHHYYLRHRYGFSIHVDHVTVFEDTLATRSSNEWTFCETNVILAIVSAAITSGQPLSELEFPDDLEAHPRFHPGRSPLYSFPHGLYPAHRMLELRDVPRWYQLWDRRQRLVGVEPRPRTQRCCGCGVEGLRCDVPGCEAPP